MSTSGPAPSHTCLIVADGSGPGRVFLRKLARRVDILIAADGATSKLLKAGLRPHYVVGDFDSVPADILEHVPAAGRVHVPDQDRCDLEKALEHAVRLGCKSAIIAGGLGKRLDHSLTTISLLLRYARSVDVRIVEPGMEVVPVVASTDIHGIPGDTLSLVVLSPARGVSLTGVRWPLVEESLEPGSRGVSNVLTEPIARLSVREGAVLACHLHGRSQAALTTSVLGEP